MLYGGFLLGLLWLFQVQFLDDFYRSIKAKEVKAAAGEIAILLQQQGEVSEIDAIAANNELCVSVLNEAYSEIYTSNQRDPRCMIDRMTQSEITVLHEEAIQNGGNASRLITKDTLREPQDQEMMQPDQPWMKNRPKGYQNMTYAQVLRLSDAQSLIVLVNAEISPVSATIATIRTQLVIVSAILVGLGLCLAFLMAKVIAAPIKKINESAKRLAQGDYHVAFSGSAYREIQELNDTLRYAAQELSKVTLLQRELLANVSHDLRTPLTMISGYGEVMRDIPGENNAQNVQVIIDEAKRLTNLVNDLLDLSKLQSGAQELVLQECDLWEMTQAMTARFQKLLNDESIHFCLSAQQGGSWRIQGDSGKLNQVLYNLINNAITYCGADKTVEVRLLDQGDHLCVEVEDHGMGIAPQDLPYVWERYYRSAHHVRAAVGSGLGLSIVKQIVELHHGVCGVRSELQKGTTFWLTLPKENHESASKSHKESYRNKASSPQDTDA